MGTGELQTDAELLRLVRDGSAEAYAILYKRYRTRLWSFAWQGLRSDAAAEDTVQDVFLYLWEKRKTIEIRQSIKAWLYGAIRNRVASALRHDSVVYNMESKAGDEPDWMASNPINVSENVEREDLRAAIESAISGLPERRREMLILRWTDGLTLAEIAEVYGVSAVAVHKNLASAEDYLRPLLEAYYKG